MSRYHHGGVSYRTINRPEVKGVVITAESIRDMKRYIDSMIGEPEYVGLRQMWEFLDYCYDQI